MLPLLSRPLAVELHHLFPLFHCLIATYLFLLDRFLGTHIGFHRRRRIGDDPYPVGRSVEIT